MVIIGVVLFVISLGFLIYSYIDKSLGINRIFPFGIMVLSLIVALFNGLFFWAEAGYQYVLVFPTGAKKMVSDPGYSFRGFAQIHPWQKFIDVKVPDEKEDLTQIEGVMKPVNLRFNDQVTANAFPSVRFQLPTSEEEFIRLFEQHRTLNNLVQSTLIPTIMEVISNTGYMYAAQDYISGSAADFRHDVADQLKNGNFSIEKVQVNPVKDDKIKKSDRAIKAVQTQYKVVKRLDSLNVPIRVRHDIAKNNIIVSQVILGDVDLEGAFKKRLQSQRDESAKRQLEQQMAKTAKAAQARFIAEGERDKAKERAAQEKIQVKQLISIETQLKTENTNRDLAKIKLETQTLEAKAKKVKADAESYANAKLVDAGLTPQEKARVEKETVIGVARELAKIKFPETMIMGGSDGKNTPLEALIGAAMAKQLGNTKK